MDTKKLRQKILDLAIRGKLVPQDPNDEPASVLLERIRAEKEQLIKEGKIKRSKKSAASDTSHYENVPFEIPKGWVWTTLGEISNYGESTNVPVDKISRESWVLELEDIEKDSGRLIQRRVKADRKINGVRHSFSNGCILYSKLRTYLNKVLIADQSGYCTTEIIPITCNKGVMPEYLCQVLRSNYFVDYTISLGYGVKMPRLGTADAIKSMIPLPPIHEQARIVALINRLATYIELLEANKQDAIEVANKIKSKILDFAVQGKLISQDPSDEPAIELLKRLIPQYKTADNRHYANLPETWEEGELGAICQLFDGKKVTDKELINLDVKYLRGAKEGDILSSGKYVPKDALMILVDGENSGEVFITPHEGYQGSTFKQLNIYPELNRDYVLLLIQHCREFLKDNKVGSAIPHLNKKLFKQIHVPIPPYNEQERIVQTVRTIMFKLDKILADL